MQSKPDDPDVCPLCRQGNFFQREEEWRFLQWTDKGSVHCQVTIALAVCSQCGKETQVPFQPRGDKPVYCSDCFAEQRQNSGYGSGGGYGGRDRY